MEYQIIQGIWEELAPLHSANLQGHRVEIRVLDGGHRRASIDKADFDKSMSRIAELTKGAGSISPTPLRAEDFYETAE